MKTKITLKAEVESSLIDKTQRQHFNHLIGQLKSLKGMKGFTVCMKFEDGTKLSTKL